jgi:hypothetical protein
VGIPEYQLWTYSFFNRPGLIGPLGVGKVLFDAFIGGFNSVGERAFMVDVGTGKEAADARVRGKQGHIYVPSWRALIQAKSSCSLLLNLRLHTRYILEVGEPSVSS